MFAIFSTIEIWQKKGCEATLLLLNEIFLQHATSCLFPDSHIRQKCGFKKMIYKEDIMYWPLSSPVTVQKLKVRGGGFPSVSLHGNVCSSCSVMTFDLMDHQDGDQQAQQGSDSKSKEEAHDYLKEEVEPPKDVVTAGLFIDLAWAHGSLGFGFTSRSK